MKHTNLITFPFSFCLFQMGHLNHTVQKNMHKFKWSVIDYLFLIIRFHTPKIRASVLKKKGASALSVWNIKRRTSFEMRYIWVSPDLRGNVLIEMPATFHLFLSYKSNVFVNDVFLNTCSWENFLKKNKKNSMLIREFRVGQ